MKGNCCARSPNEKWKLFPKEPVRLFARSIFIEFENNARLIFFHLPTKSQYTFHLFSLFLGGSWFLFLCFMKHLIPFSFQYGTYILRIPLFSPFHFPYSSNSRNQRWQNRKQGSFNSGSIFLGRTYRKGQNIKKIPWGGGRRIRNPHAI